jgi:hypothetical protein
MGDMSNRLVGYARVSLGADADARTAMAPERRDQTSPAHTVTGQESVTSAPGLAE